MDCFVGWMLLESSHVLVAFLFFASSSPSFFRFFFLMGYILRVLSGGILYPFDLSALNLAFLCIFRGCSGFACHL
jgi:hypothetical protein